VGTDSARLDLYWIPLGAGGPRIVRFSGATYEAITARLRRRERCDLYHAALIARTTVGSFTIEMTPVPNGSDSAERGVVAEGPVGVRWARRLRIFRYEIRAWRDGVIPDLQYAVASPVRITDDAARAQRVIDVLPHVPTPTWGRDELGAGDMWNSNSVIAWVLTRAGLLTDAVRPPVGGRAPGWDAGLVAARTDEVAG
jgi:hypothetical protein